MDSPTGEIRNMELTREEKELWLNCFAEKMGRPGPEEEAWFTGRRQLGLGVGLDAASNLVREKAAGEA